MPADVDDVVKALELAQDRGLPWVALGLGSNVLVKDAGFPGVVIRIGKGLDRFEMKGATAIVGAGLPTRSEEHTSELQSQSNLVCRLLLEKKKKTKQECNRLT